MKYLKVILIFFFLSMVSVKAYFESPVDVMNLDIFEIQDLIDKGYLSYENLVKIYLDRIKTYDSKYKAIISINENAVEEAKACDKEFKNNGRSNILYCIPVIVKDNIDVKGLPTTAGSKALSDSYPYEDADVIKKLKAKGMIVLAKANMSAFAFSATSSASHYGTVKNAYNVAYSAFGSSGGSAVAVALNYAPVALGTDTNASLRAPASAANVIGFRSTLNLISTKGIIAYDTTRDVVGPITKTVQENALILSALTGDEYDLSNSSLEGKRIGVVDQFVNSSDSKIKTLFNEAVAKLEENGATIVHLKNFYSSTYESVGNVTLGGWTMCHAFNSYIKNTSSKIKSFYALASSSTFYSLWENYRYCNTSISYINEMEAKKTSYRTHVSNTFKNNQLDAIIYPTMNTKVIKVGGSGARLNSHKIASVLGLPSVSVPLGFIDNLPYGIEFLGNKNSEQVLYDIIYSYQNVNNTMKLPDDAKNLYEIPSSIERLKKVYEATINSKTHIYKYTILEEEAEKISEFFINYDSYENKEEKATKLYDEYLELLMTKMIEYDEENNSFKYNEINYFKIFLYLVIIIILLKFLKATSKKRR